MGSNDLTSLKSKLQELRKATEIVLMIVPYPASFRVRVNESQLAQVACVYAITSGRGPTFDHVMDIIDGAVVEYDNGPKDSVDLRIGIVFRGNGKILQEFYFDDWGGHHKVNGFSHDHRMVASADFPSQLRSVLERQDVILIRDSHLRCSHS